MGDKTGIAWTDSTWNPVRGCTKVSAGCKNCYAETFAERWRGVPGHAFEQGFDVRLVPEALGLPLRWQRPRRIFVNSMSDLFHEAVPDAFVLQVFDVIRRCHTERPGHVFQVLTKRAERMRDFCARLRFDGAGTGRLWLSATPAPSGFAAAGDGYALVRGLTNLWLGVSVEDQAAAEERIPLLLATPAHLRFLSCEPLLGPVELRMGEGGLRSSNARLEWVIVGGESGPGARPCDAAWIRSLVGQCAGAGVPAFVKQLGARFEDREGRLYGRGALRWENGDLRARLGDRAGADPEEWPADLRVQEFPGGGVPLTRPMLLCEK